MLSAVPLQPAKIMRIQIGWLHRLNMSYWVLLERLAEKRESAGIGSSDAGMLQCMGDCWQALAMLHGPWQLQVFIATLSGSDLSD